MSVSALLEESAQMRKNLDRSEARRRMRGLDAGIVAASRWRAFRRFLVFVALLVLLLELAGVPHLRISYSEQGGRIVTAEYWSVTGPERIAAGQVAPTCPLIVLVPLKRSLLDYAAEALSLEE